MNALNLPDDPLIQEHAYLVARGVRPLALIGHAMADELTMLRVATRIEALACGRAIPFVLDRGDGVCDYGYAAERWVVDLLRWATLDPTVPASQRARIVGLLLGYSADAIQRFEQEAPVRLFGAASCASGESASSSPPGGIARTAGSAPPG